MLKSILTIILSSLLYTSVVSAVHTLEPAHPLSSAQREDVYQIFSTLRNKHFKLVDHAYLAPSDTLYELQKHRMTKEQLMWYHHGKVRMYQEMSDQFFQKFGLVPLVDYIH